MNHLDRIRGLSWMLTDLPPGELQRAAMDLRWHVDQIQTSWQPLIADVLRERLRQDEKWGEQNHPDGTGEQRGLTYSLIIAADTHRHAADMAAKRGLLTWRHILLEEVYEALAEDDPARLRKELIQVAAVALAWIEAIDRRGDAQ